MDWNQLKVCRDCRKILMSIHIMTHNYSSSKYLSRLSTDQNLPSLYHKMYQRNTIEHICHNWYHLTLLTTTFNSCINPHITQSSRRNHNPNHKILLNHPICSYRLSNKTFIYIFLYQILSNKYSSNNSQLESYSKGLHDWCMRKRYCLKGINS